MSRVGERGPHGLGRGVSPVPTKKESLSVNTGAVQQEQDWHPGRGTVRSVQLQCSEQDEARLRGEVGEVVRSHIF